MNNAQSPKYLMEYFGGRKGFIGTMQDMGVEVKSCTIDHWFRVDKVPEYWQVKAYFASGGKIPTDVKWVKLYENAQTKMASD